MCGIFGIVGKKIDEAHLKKATDLMAHRGPNDSGFFIEDGVGLGHRRLSIIDLEGGHQPMYNEDGALCIVFNGEIYNFPELYERLVLKKHRFKTRSDTETILHAYEEWGEDCVDHLRGMFAFAIWNRKEKKLFVARDRFGIKPLFYAEHGGTFYFASEMKAILADPAIRREMDEVALACYFSLSYIPDSMTIFKGIRKLLPGHTLTWLEGQVVIRKYWDIEYVPDRGKSEDFFINRFMELFQESVRIHLISDVPLGAFLSGGIDSSAVVAFMSMVTDRPVNTFCMGFGGAAGGYLDEREYARKVAAKYKANHREYEVLPDPEGLLEKIVRSFDEPFADDSTIPSYFVCKIARENVTVSESGLGGDEAFAGYERYLGFKARGLYGKLPYVVREGLIRRFVENLPERSDGHYTVNHMKRFVRSSSLDDGNAYYGYLSILNPGIQKSFFFDSSKFGKYLEVARELILDYFRFVPLEDDRDTLNRAFYCDIKTYLPEDILAVTDRMSMYHALEVRVPFLDHPLMEFCATIPPEMKMKWFRKKYLLKKAVRNILPAEVIDHRKQGFVGPMAQWLKNDLRAYTAEALAEKNLKKHGLLNHETIKNILNEHFSGREIHDTLIWSLLVFQKWFDLYMDGDYKAGH
jgi:asparagine synthase (glutamine-hydrolysing)